MSKISDILSAAKVLLSAKPDELESLKGDAEVMKALSGLRARDLQPGETVGELWSDNRLHGSATRQEIKVGPGQESSGRGAERMVREYSNPAPQHGVALDPESLARDLSFMANSMKSLSDGISALPAAIVEAMKAKKTSEDEEDEEESKVVEINASKKAKESLVKARRLVTRIETLKSEMDDCEGDERKAKRKSVKALIKELGQLLAKAQLFAYAADNSELKKSVRVIAAKADINVVQEEEEDEEEEDDEKKKARKAKEDAEAAAAKAAAAEALKNAVGTAVTEALKAAGIDLSKKAKTDDKGNQCDDADPKTGNQAASAKASGEFDELKSKLEESLKGNDALKLQLNQLFDVVAGKTKLSDLIPDLSKAKPTDIIPITEKIDDMEEAGQLTVVEAAAAREIASLAKASAEGTMPYSRVSERLQKTTSNVVELFKSAGVKAA